MIDIIKLLAIFAMLVIVLRLTKYLSLAVGCAAALTAILYRIGFVETIILVGKGLTRTTTIYTVLAFYTITFLQRMLEKRKRLVMAQQALSGIFNNQRVNASLAPILIGMLPSPAVATICGSIVKEATGDSLPEDEKAFVTSYYRHIFESFLPTYNGIIISTTLSGIALSSFLTGMFPMVLVLVSLGFVFYLRKVPKETGLPPSKNKLKDVWILVSNLWTIIFVVVMVMTLNGRPVIGILGMPFAAVSIAIVLDIFVDKYSWTDIKPMFRSAFEAKLIVNTLTIMMFREILEYSNVIGVLPSAFQNLPVPTFLMYVIIFFFGTVISGQQAIIVVGIPMAFADPHVAGGMPLLVLLMSTAYAAMQISPTHVCLAVVIDYFKIGMGALVKKTLPVILTFLVIASGYYLLLTSFGVR